MRVVFRADASLQIGTGHVMRCLTLAQALAAKGGECEFICREHPGALIDFVRRKGFVVHTLRAGEVCSDASRSSSELAHAHWLGASQEDDAAACVSVLQGGRPDWIVVDHYALDASWEVMLRARCGGLMVIDDLADRRHECDLLLDQTFGRSISDYRPWVPHKCRLLCGSQYALLRPEFAQLRPYSLLRRAEPELKQLLITMGGVDKNNATRAVLATLRSSALPPECGLTVVMGAVSPWLNDVQEQARTMPWKTDVLVGVADMGQLMSDSDLVIGAAGSTSWERCCLGVPTIMVVTAPNQIDVARNLAKAEAAMVIGMDQSIAGVLPELIESMLSPKNLYAISQAAAEIVDGRGVDAIAALLEHGRVS